MPDTNEVKELKAKVKELEKRLEAVEEFLSDFPTDFPSFENYETSSTYNPQFDDVDELFDEAVKVVCQHGKASSSLLQRYFSIGYNRAARIIDQLHEGGVISAPYGSKPRDVLIKNVEEYLKDKK